MYAEDAGHGVRIVLTRKAASEIVPGDVVHLDGQLTKEPYMVLGINQRKGLLGIALKGYGEVQIHPDAPINCREGAW
ncbi:MAG: hypothetical protein RET84_02605 [Pseudomonadota bacterium]|nr:hypothetical protein [Pseudomonadota bacterium]